MWKGFVVSLHIAKAEAQSMIDMQEGHAVPGKGLEGDRYFLGTGYFSRHHGPSYEVTLIESETIDALNEEFEDLHLNPRDARRNIVTCGVPLNHLVAHKFQVGEVTLRGIRLCHPCLHIANVVHHNMLSGLIHRGGLRAQILTAGIIRIGDPIVDLGEDHLPLVSDVDERYVVENVSPVSSVRD
ncbi:MAG: MOSC domain-containing protein [Ktedonobacteraceae bacterium]